MRTAILPKGEIMRQEYWNVKQNYQIDVHMQYLIKLEYDQ